MNIHICPQCGEVGAPGNVECPGPRSRAEGTPSPTQLSPERSSATSTIPVSYWLRIRHRILTLLGVHVWGNPLDITPKFWRDTYLRCSLVERKCQQCDMVSQQIQ